MKKQGKSSGSKFIRPLSSKKAPEPTGDHVVVIEWMKGQMPRLQPILAQLDEMILETISGLTFAVKWKKAYYGLPEQGWIIEVSAYDFSVNILFFGGADFDMPPPLGDVDRSRYIKLRSVEEAQDAHVAHWIRQASVIPGWK
ncbi:MAG: DUF1801 domain-containing protein [Fimbriimonadaceae bacterium]